MADARAATRRARSPFRRTAALLLAAAAFGSACSLLVGVDDLHFAPDAAGDGPRAREAGPDSVVHEGGSADTGMRDDGSPEAPTPCTLPAVLCDGICVTDLTSSANCGRCGHDCGGGACEAGTCQPFPLAPADQPAGLAVDGEHVYWTNWGASHDAGTVLRVSVEGGVPETLAAGVVLPGSIAVDAERVFYTVGGTFKSKGAVVRVTLDGGSSTVLASSQPSPEGLVLDTDHVYWTDPMTGVVQSIPKTGGAPLKVSSSTQPGMLAIAGPWLYWTDTLAKAVLRAKTRGGTAVTIAPGLDFPVYIAASGSEVAWTDLGTTDAGDVRSLASDGGQRLLGKGGTPEGIALGPAFVYWAQGTGSIVEAPKLGGTPVTLATKQLSPTAVATYTAGGGATTVYWLDAHHVMKVVP